MRIVRDAEWLRSRLIQSGDCLVWSGARVKGGYGLFRMVVGGVRIDIATHRFAWELAFGPIPEGMLVCHKCDNPPCCRPDHLFLGTHADNAVDRFAKGRAEGRRNWEAAHNNKASRENLSEARRRRQDAMVDTLIANITGETPRS